jgi:hypothetical protein
MGVAAVTAVLVLTLIRRARPLKVAFLIVPSMSLRIECYRPLDYFVELIPVEPNASAIGTAIDLDSLAIHWHQFLAANRALHLHVLRGKWVACFPFRVSCGAAPVISASKKKRDSRHENPYQKSRQLTPVNGKAR